MSILSKVWKAVAFLGAFLTLMATVKADDAMSNIASYPKLLGMDNLAASLGPNADGPALFSGIALLALSSLLWTVGRPNRTSGSVIEDQIVTISELVENRHPIVMAKTFKRCLIKGPVRLGVLNRNAFNLCQSEGAFFVEMPVGSPRGGVILLENVEFFECFFAADACLEATAANVSQLRPGVEENRNLQDWKDKIWSPTTKLRSALTHS